MSPSPVRLQLSRKKGFDLQALSMATNGLPAVNVARPSKWGNPHDWREWRDNFPADILAEQGSAFRDRWCKEQVVESFIQDCRERSPDASALRGKNLACWCGSYDRCHADVLLEIANR